MMLMSWQSGWKSVKFSVLVALLIAPCTGHAATKSDQLEEMTPSVRIPVGPLGYMAPSAAYLSLRYALTTVDFIDKDHLLFTYHVNHLLHRLPDENGSDNDQMIHAVVVDIGNGKVTQQADWRMRDRQRYLWALNDGQFLVRQRNSLFLTDEHLQLRPYLTFDTDLEALELSPDRKLMLLEIAKAEPAQPKTAPSTGPSLLGPGSSANDDVQDATEKKLTELLLVRPGDKTVVARSEAKHTVDLPLTDDGFIEQVQGIEPNQWVLRKTNFTGKPKEFGFVRSTCVPTLQPLSETVVLTVHCSANRTLGNKSVTAISTQDGTLWRNEWSDKYVWPDFAYAADGSRFAYESLAMDHPIGAMESFGEQDVKAQPVGVFDTDTGKLELVENASPILSGGHNFALSADGRRFAILRGGEIEIYDLPPVPAVVKKGGKEKK
jgi:hypothetical protein